MLYKSKACCLLVIILMIQACGGGSGSGSSSNSVSISLNQSSVSFEQVKYGAVPAAQTVVANFKGDGVIVGYAPGVVQADWLNINTISNTSTSATFELSINDNETRFMSPGNYTTSLRFVTGDLAKEKTTYKTLSVSLFLDQEFTTSNVSDITFQAMENVQEQVFPLSGHTFYIHGSKTQWKIATNDSWLKFSETQGNGEASIKITTDISNLSNGDYTGEFTVTDQTSNKVETANVTLTVQEQLVASELPSISGALAGVDITDIAVDNERASVYVTDSNSRELFFFSVNENKGYYIQFENIPDRIFFDPTTDKLYVSLIGQEHSRYWWSEDQSGNIAVIDVTHKRLERLIPLDFAPSDLFVTPDGMMLVAGGSGQHTAMVAYDLSSNAVIKEETVSDSTTIIPDSSFSNFYLTAQVTAAHFEKYNLSSSGFSRMGSTRDLDSNPNFFYDSFDEVVLSSDDKLALTKTGQIYNTEDLSYVDTIDMSSFQDWESKKLIDAVFDETTNKLFVIAPTSDHVLTYSLDDWRALSTHGGSQKEYAALFMINDTVYVVETTNTNAGIKAL